MTTLNGGVRRALSRGGVPWTLLAVALLVGCELPLAPGVADYADELFRRKGTLTVATESVSVVTAEYTIRDFRLESTTGLVVRGRLRVPVGASGADRRPTVLLLGGLQRGSDIITLFRDTLPQVGAALDYPAALDAEDAADALRDLETLRRVAWDIPAGVLLTVDYLLAQPSVDPQRLALVGASFGGFFSPAAAAADPRIANLGLMYAGGDLAGLLAGHLEGEVPNSGAQLGSELALLQLQQLEPVRYVGDVAPRPVLLVNGLFDDLVLRRSTEAMIRAARAPKDVVWLPTEHLSPDNQPLLRELVDTALARLPVLR